jgi:hypothetical protein
MGTPVSETIDPAQITLLKKKLTLNNKMRNGASWLFLIAGLSLLNTVLFLAKTDVVFVIGLGITKIADGLLSALAENSGTAATAITILQIFVDVLFASFYLLLGLLAIKRTKWAYVTGIVVYTLDTMIVLFSQAYLSVIFHIMAVAGIAAGLGALKNLEKLEKDTGAPLETDFNQEPPAISGTLD